MNKRILSLFLSLVTVLTMTITVVAEEAAVRELNIVAVKPATVEDYETNDFTLWLEEKSGIHINFVQLPSDGITEKVAMMIAGNDLPDAFMGCSFTTDSLLQYGQSGILLPLDDLLEEHAPNFLKAMEYFEHGLDLIRQADGNIYSLPSINPCYHCTYANKMWINTVWLDNLGLATPTTIDEFTEVLRAFRDNDANGNGDPSDEIPLAGSSDGWYTQSYTYLINSFLYFDNRKNGFMLDDNKEVYNALNKEEFRNALSYLNMLYEEGLLYEGSLTQTNDQLKKLVENPNGNLVGATTAGYGGQIASEIGNERYREYFAIEPLKGPEGVKYAMSALQLPSVGQFVITSACEEPTLALEYADYFYTSEVTASLFNGIEGVGWRWAKEGEIGFNGEPAQWAAVAYYSGDTGDTQNYCWTQTGIYNFSAEWRGSQAVEEGIDLLSGEGMEYMLHKVTQEMYEPYSGLQYNIPTLNYDESTVRRITDLEYEFKNYYDTMIYSFITGELDIDDDGDWNEHLDNLEYYSVDEMIEIYQTAYDAMYK
ncbi:MAG: extracellular solute-binding protein [Christensenellales bacterium]|jgi:putative aldouronate transport system substrate-binding protein